MKPELWDALQEAGVSVTPVGADQVRLARADNIGNGVVATVHRKSAPLAPSHAHRAHGELSGDVLLVVPSASPAALAAAVAAGCSVVALNAGSAAGPTGHVLLPDGVVSIGAAGSQAPAVSATRPGRRPWGRFAVVRQLLTHPWTTQQDLAARAGVTQPRVSQTLQQLHRDGLVRRSARGGATGRAGWEPVDWESLLTWWLHSYPGPGGIATYWYGLDSPTEQVRTALATLGPNASRLAVSGDVAADVLAPWRRPVRAVVYAQLSSPPDGRDLDVGSLTPSGAAEATLELIVPADPGVWAPIGTPASEADAPHEQLPLADLLQVVWDVHRAPGSDRDQAVAALLPILRARLSGALR